MNPASCAIFSSTLKDLNGEAYAPGLAGQAPVALDPQNFPPLKADRRFGAPVTGISKFVAIGLDYARSRQGTGFSDPPNPSSS